MTKRDSEPVAPPQATSEKCGKVIWYQSAPHVCVLPKEHEGRCNDAAAQPAAGTRPQAERQYTHHVFCNGDRRKRPGTKGVCCSCFRNEDYKHGYVAGLIDSGLPEEEALKLLGDEARAVAPVETPVTKCCNRWYLHRHVETPPTRNCCKCGAPISECMGFVKASDFADLLNGVRPGIVDGRCNIRELCGKCALLFMWDGDNLIKREIVETRPTAEQFMRERYKKIFPKWTQANLDKYIKEIQHWLEFAEAYAKGLREEIERLKPVLLSFVKKFRIKTTGGICQICRCRFKHSDECLVRKAEQLL